MSASKPTWTRAVFGAAVAVALGFGAAQAYAAPGSAEQVRRYCDEGDCVRVCGGQGMGGICWSNACVCHPL